MLITRLYLRNFRVYEDELDLEIPPGLVGIYGPNGSGKSTLLEAIIYTLWGKARTTREHIRSSGVNGDCVTEVEFEHEGHLYLVRRSLKGINSSVSVEAHCDGLLMSTGTRDAERYVESILGLDDTAFRASVFTEQKQLAAFSNQPPAERKKLVLSLLGVSPLDAARDEARKDARELTRVHDQARSVLPDLAALEVAAEDASAAAAASQAVSADEEAAARAAGERAAAADAVVEVLELRRQEHDALLVEGRQARSDLNRATDAITAARTELEALAVVADRIPELETRLAQAAGEEEALDALTAACAARRALDAAMRAMPEPPPPVDDAAVESTAAAAARAAEDLAAARAHLQNAEADLERARRAVSVSDGLDREADCPTCGQALGDAFETVRAHRQAEVAAAEDALAVRRRQVEDLAAVARTSTDRHRSAAAAAEAARRGRSEWDKAEARRAEAERHWEEAWAAAAATGAIQWIPVGSEPAGGGASAESGGAGAESGGASAESGGAGAGSGAPALAALEAATDMGRRRVADLRASREQLVGLRVRLERRPALEAELARAGEEKALASARVENLLDKVRTLAFKAEDLDAAQTARRAAREAAERAVERARAFREESIKEIERSNAAAQRLADGRIQHAGLLDLEADARHRARVGDLLSEFRNTVVASVGPRLADQAAQLFGELTDNEYERLDVDPETYQIQISDGGRLYGLDRFSGSEVDLANLALRVAISEHIHFQSGGSVGLLVLDEVFGPLDEDRKARMLLALERLRARFRQVLVVTHDSEIKEQMPSAIEVIKRPGRRASARVVGV